MGSDGESDGGSEGDDDGSSQGRPTSEERKLRRAALRARLQANIASRSGPRSRSAEAMARQMAPTPVPPVPEAPTLPEPAPTRTRLVKTVATPAPPQRKRVKTVPPPVPAAPGPAQSEVTQMTEAVADRTAPTGRLKRPKGPFVGVPTATPAYLAAIAKVEAEEATEATEVRKARSARRSSIVMDGKPASTRAADGVTDSETRLKRGFPWIPIAIGAPIAAGLVVLFVALNGGSGKEAPVVAEPEPVAQAEAEVVAEPAPEPVAEPVPVAVAVPEPVPEPVAEAEAVAEPVAEAEPVAKATPVVAKPDTPTNPRSASAWYAEGRRVQSSAPTHALYAYRMAARMGHVSAYRRLGHTAAQLGRRQDAVQAYRRYLERRPTARDADDVRARIARIGE